MGLKLNFLSTVGSIASVFSLIAIVFGAYLFLHSQMNAVAGEMERKAVETFKQQKILIEDTMDERYLEQLQCQKILVEKELIRDNNDTLLKDKLEKINKNIDKLEKSIEKRIEDRLKELDKELP